MTKKYREPDYYSFTALAKKLDISQDRIEQDFKTGKITRFLIDNLFVESFEPTMRRIGRLMPILNEYAREHLFDGPAGILTLASKKHIKLSDVQKNLLKTNLNSDSFFAIWLNEFGIDINTIKIAIPQDESVKYENYLKGDLDTNSDSCSGQKTDYNPDVPPTQNNDLELCARLKAADFTDKQIAQELKSKFPTIYPSRIGRLIIMLTVFRTGS